MNESKSETMALISDFLSPLSSYASQIGADAMKKLSSASHCISCCTVPTGTKAPPWTSPE